MPKYFLKVADYSWKPGSQKEVIYKDDKGELFIGPPMNVIIGKTYVVEVSSKRPEDIYYYIIKFIGGPK